MVGLIFSQMSLWVIFILGLLVMGGLTLWKGKHPGYSAGLAALFSILLVTTYSLGIRYGTGVDDWCVLNGHVTGATYSESWTEEYYTTEDIKDSKGNTVGSRTVRHETEHPPHWSVSTTLGDEAIDAPMYAGFARNFRNEVQTESHHSGQCSSGDGRTYETRWPGDRRTLVPWCRSQEIINWVKASYGTVYRTKGGDGYPVPGYPTLIDTPHGPKQPRVIHPEIILDSAWAQTMEWDMDVLADAVGASRQCNPLLVITKRDVGFVQALRDKWINGKKNDVIIVIGSSTWPTIDWVQVVSWTSNESLEPFIKQALSETDLNDRGAVMKAITTGINSHFQRKPMAEFEYLKNEIHIPTWLYIVCMLYLTGAAVGVLFLPSMDDTISINSYYRGRRF